MLSRQAELKALTRKYAADVDGVLAWADAARERLAGLDTSDEALAALAARRDGARRRAGRARGGGHRGAHRRPPPGWPPTPPPSWPGWRCRTPGCWSPWRRGRRDRARPRPCGSAGALLVAGADGVDEVELRLVAHAGAAPQPLHKGASGGELSRVMLALEVALAGADPVPTMVFDEVDAGVGGRAAVEIGRRLARLAARHQVIVVTHLPQVAAYADRHLVVDKSAATAAAAPPAGSARWPSGDRIVELARMLAGLDDTDTGRAHAEELLAAARAHREADRAAAARRAATRKPRRPRRPPPLTAPSPGTPASRRPHVHAGRANVVARRRGIWYVRRGSPVSRSRLSQCPA